MGSIQRWWWDVKTIAAADDELEAIDYDRINSSDRPQFISPHGSVPLHEKGGDKWV